VPQTRRGAHLFFLLVLDVLVGSMKQNKRPGFSVSVLPTPSLLQSHISANLPPSPAESVGQSCRSRRRESTKRNGSGASASLNRSQRIQSTTVEVLAQSGQQTVFLGAEKNAVGSSGFFLSQKSGRIRVMLLDAGSCSGESYVFATSALTIPAARVGFPNVIPLRTDHHLHDRVLARPATEEESKTEFGDNERPETEDDNKSDAAVEDFSDDSLHDLQDDEDEDSADEKERLEQDREALEESLLNPFEADLVSDMQTSAKLVGRKNAEDSFRHYLLEIGARDLLTAKQEVDLGTYVAKLTKLEQVKKLLQERLGRPPTEDEWAKAAGHPSGSEFVKTLLLGRRAKERLVASNLRWVVAVAKKYKGRGSLTLQDLIQEGNLGLMKAADKFDPTRGYRFTTYSGWWIRQYISRALQNRSRAIRLPVHINEKLTKIRKATGLLFQRLGRKPTEDEIASFVGVSVDQLRVLQQASTNTLSLDAPLNADEGQSTTMGDLIETPDESAFDRVDRRIMKEDVDGLLSMWLSPREKDIIRMRFGLDDGTPKTLSEIGEALGVTRERIRQIEQKAMRKLKHPGRNLILRDYVK